MTGESFYPGSHLLLWHRHLWFSHPLWHKFLLLDRLLLYSCSYCKAMKIWEQQNLLQNYTDHPLRVMDAVTTRLDLVLLCIYKLWDCPHALDLNLICTGPWIACAAAAATNACMTPPHLRLKCLRSAARMRDKKNCPLREEGKALLSLFDLEKALWYHRKGSTIVIQWSICGRAWIINS